mmetsp:Transcript_85868/g.199615  ORF Transcript_85868/g.199615 Transcript_85868/m.199615 type:complete len:227 (-) Transcript_85868:142-822(-)
MLRSPVAKLTCHSPPSSRVTVTCTVHPALTRVGLSSRQSWCSPLALQWRAWPVRQSKPTEFSMAPSSISPSVSAETAAVAAAAPPTLATRPTTTCASSMLRTFMLKLYSLPEADVESWLSDRTETYKPQEPPPSAILYSKRWSPVLTTFAKWSLPDPELATSHKCSRNSECSLSFKVSQVAMVSLIEPQQAVGESLVCLLLRSSLNKVAPASSDASVSSTLWIPSG